MVTFRSWEDSIKVSSALTAWLGLLFSTEMEVNAMEGTNPLFFSELGIMVNAPSCNPKMRLPSGRSMGTASEKRNLS